MAKVRYQIFLSSTFRDLKDERQAVVDAVLSIGHFPSGMELFPASDATPWALITRVIDDSDYYVLILGGTYGSTDSSGISYTEREFDYAVKKGIPILAFLHQNPADIPAGKTEIEKNAKKKLDVFRKKVQMRHCKYWTTPHDLQYKVAVGLVQEINVNPTVGWVRANEGFDAAIISQASEIKKALEETKTERDLREKAENRILDLEKELETLNRRLADRALEFSLEALGDQKVNPYVGLSLPPSFILESAEDILIGKTDQLSGFVIWSETPQGHNFWSEENANINEGMPLSDKAKKALNDMIRLASRRSKWPV